jgi:hypothetical protein
MGAEARRVAEARFSRQRMVSDLEAIYDSARGKTRDAVALSARRAALGGGPR